LTQKKAKSSFVEHYFFVLIFLFSLSISVDAVDAFDTLNLLFNPTSKPPIFIKPKVIYEINFVFNKCPQEYILYYDRIQKKMIIDFYSTAVTWLDTTRYDSFSGELNVRNVETAMSLFGQKGQIVFTLQKKWIFEQGWHYESSIVSPTTLRVKFWIELRPAIEAKRKIKE